MGKVFDFLHEMVFMKKNITKNKEEFWVPGWVSAFNLRSDTFHWKFLVLSVLLLLKGDLVLYFQRQADNYHLQVLIEENTTRETYLHARGF